MRHDWEFPPPLPDRGDDNRDTVFLGVGKVMSAWETMEFELSRLYSVLASDPDGDAMRDYGKPTIARLRLDGLWEAAERFFVKSPSQEREARLATILARVRHFVSRRNEVAHGIVYNIEPIAAFSQHLAQDARGKPQYALIAPYYQIKQHASDGMPAYAYTRQMLEALIPAMAGPFHEIERFRLDLLAPDKSRVVPKKPSPAKARKPHRNAAQRSARRRQRRSR
jgi:hypothetical protein